jgi:hypothetical protein
MIRASVYLPSPEGDDAASRERGTVGRVVSGVPDRLMLVFRLAAMTTDELVDVHQASGGENAKALDSDAGESLGAEVVARTRQRRWDPFAPFSPSNEVSALRAISAWLQTRGPAPLSGDFTGTTNHRVMMAARLRRSERALLDEAAARALAAAEAIVGTGDV